MQFRLHFSVACPNVLSALLLFILQTLRLLRPLLHSLVLRQEIIPLLLNILQLLLPLLSLLVHQTLFHIGELFQVSQLFMQLFFLSSNFFLIFFRPVFFTCRLILNPLLLLCTLVPFELFTQLPNLGLRISLLFIPLDDQDPESILLISPRLPACTSLTTWRDYSYNI